MKRKGFRMPRKIMGALLTPLVLLALFPAPANAYPLGLAALTTLWFGLLWGPLINLAEDATLFFSSEHI